MKKYFADIDAGRQWLDPHIKEVDYDHYVDITISTVMAYDGDVDPKCLTRAEKKTINYSMFWKSTLYNTYSEAEEYLKKRLEERLKEIKPEFENLKIEIGNIETALKKYGRFIDKR